MKTIYIYALIDPRDYLARYVGQTVDKKQRLSIHISEAKGSKKADTPKSLWIQDLLRGNLEPRMVILDQTTDLDETVRLETEFI